MIIEVEDRYCKAVRVFAKLLDKVQRAAKRGDAVHDVEEMTFADLMEIGRETVAAFIEEQKEDIPRPADIEYEGKTLQRLPEPRVREYVSAFGRRRSRATFTPRGKRNVRKWCPWTRNWACRRAIPRTSCRNGAARSS